MSKEYEQSIDGDSVDLMDMLLFLWQQKLVLTVVATLSGTLGFFYHHQYPDEYSALIPVTVDTSISVPLQVFNLIQMNEASTSQGLSSKFELSYETTLESFEREFNDYKEVMDVLGGHASVAHKMGGMSLSEKNDLLLSLAKKFQLSFEPSPSNKLFLEYKWDDPLVGRQLADEIIIAVVASLRLRLLAEIDAFADALDYYNQLEVAKLNENLEAIGRTLRKEQLSRYQFLSEQAMIARKIGHSGAVPYNGQSSVFGLGSATQSNGSATQSNVDYLKGFLVLEQEMRFMKERSDEHVNFSDGLYAHNYRALEMKLRSQLVSRVRESGLLIADLINSDNIFLNITRVKDAPRRQLRTFLPKVIALGVVPCIVIMVFLFLIGRRQVKPT